MPVKSMLLIGPTGVGKTPFGDYLEERGLGGKRCFHFDFGHQLRSAARHDGPAAEFTRGEYEFIRKVLDEGLLLEDEHFHIAEKVMDVFLHRSGFGGDDILVLNGLPRHAGQALDMGRKVNITCLAVLDCDAEDIYTRIRDNTGGDRLGRADDGIEMVRRKLDIFHQRTAPLIRYYEAAGRGIFRLKVTHSSTAGDLYSDFLSLAKSLRI